MSTLSDLLKTKAQLEALAEKEHQEAIAKDQQERREKVLAENLRQQKQLDGARFSGTAEIVKNLNTVIGDRLNNPDFLLYLLVTVFGARQDWRTITVYLESIIREYDLQKK